MRCERSKHKNCVSCILAERARNYINCHPDLKANIKSTNISLIDAENWAEQHYKNKGISEHRS
jgi:hypothetical protein